MTMTLPWLSTMPSGSSSGWAPCLFSFPIPKVASVPFRCTTLHHIATGYETNLRGEGELAAWELAAGCKNNRAAFFLGMLTAAVGMVIAPMRTCRAWQRGRRGATLCKAGYPGELLDLHLGELRARMGCAPGRL